VAVTAKHERSVAGTGSLLVAPMGIGLFMYWFFRSFDHTLSKKGRNEPL